MLKSPFLFAVSVLVTLLSWTTIAQAKQDNVALDFTLPPAQPQTLSPLNSQKLTEQALPENSLPAAASPSNTSATTLPDNKPPVEAPPVETPMAGQPQSEQPLVRYTSPLPPIDKSAPLLEDTSPPPNKTQLDKTQPDAIGLSFASNDIKLPTSPEEIATSLSSPRIDNTNSAHSGNSKHQGSNTTEHSTPISFNSLGLDDWIFEGGSSSLVAHTVGSAEGTRMANGRRTQAYYGHTDPGNGVWNLGTFSYQHGAQTPEEADEKQLLRLKRQSLQLEEQARASGIELTLEAKLNGIDLANQAPLAALDRGGYIEQLAKAYRLNMEGTDAIVWARTHAYLDPDTKRWNAPGLGNNVYSIDRDQRRRADAIAQAQSAYSGLSISGLQLDNLDDISLTGTDETSSPANALVGQVVRPPNHQLGSAVANNQNFAEDLADAAMLNFGLPPAANTPSAPSVTTEPNNPANLLASITTPPANLPASNLSAGNRPTDNTPTSNTSTSNPQAASPPEAEGPDSHETTQANTAAPALSIGVHFDSSDNDLVAIAPLPMQPAIPATAEAALNQTTPASAPQPTAAHDEIAPNSSTSSGTSSETEPNETASTEGVSSHDALLPSKSAPQTAPLQADNPQTESTETIAHFSDTNTADSTEASAATGNSHKPRPAEEDSTQNTQNNSDNELLNGSPETSAELPIPATLTPEQKKQDKPFLKRFWYYEDIVGNK